VSIFVNPMQFGPKEDLATYPRDLQADCLKCQTAGVDLVFCPSVEEMYGTSFFSYIDMTGPSQGLCGKKRETFFKGVCTVVGKLFNIVAPDRAYFGEKDAQQLMVVRRMVKDLNFDIEIIGGETVREADGLAMSSRNSYLDETQRQAATVINRALCRGKALVAQGETSAARVKEEIRQTIEQEPLATVEYVDIVRCSDTEPIETLSGEFIAAVAVNIGKVRLIDNFIYK
ncbi:MAG: pantoate--beta-alanine ligase, partial [Anaerovoracaceae bacterium]